MSHDDVERGACIQILTVTKINTKKNNKDPMRKDNNTTKETGQGNSCGQGGKSKKKIEGQR
jgi:hypothetical protein